MLLWNLQFDCARVLLQRNTILRRKSASLAVTDARCVMSELLESTRPQTNTQLDLIEIPDWKALLHVHGSSC